MIADNDDPGEKHALDVAKNLHGIADHVRIVRLPGSPPKGDISDWLDAGGDAEALVEICRRCPVFEPGPAEVHSETADAHAPQTQAGMLAEVARSADLFHAPDGTCFADIEVDGHRETWPVGSKGFRRWLTKRFFEETQKAPSSEAMSSARNLIEAPAQFDGPERAVFVRIGGIGGRIYLDLCNETWQAVEVDASGGRRGG